MRAARDDALDERLVPRAAVDDVLEALRRVEDDDLVAPVGRVAGPRELRHLLDGELVADVEAGVHAQRRDEARFDDQETDREADGQRLAVDAQVLGELLVSRYCREPAGPLVGGRVVVAAARAPRDLICARRPAQAAEPRRRREGRRARDEQGERRVAAAHDASRVLSSAGTQPGVATCSSFGLRQLPCPRSAYGSRYNRACYSRTRYLQYSTTL